LGYATLLNQGKPDFGRAGLPPHYHVHKRDMERAFEYFGEALNYNADNPSALYNYKILSDTLKRTPQYDLSSDTTANVLKYATESNVSSDVFELLDFSSYEEVLFLLDISGSMVMEKVICKGKDRFTVMKETALHILKQMPETTQLGIATIGGDCGTEPKLWVETGNINKKDLKQSIEFLAPDGTTPLLTILQETPALLSKKSKQRKAIFFISDGANICSGGGVDICEWSKRLNQQGVTINIFTFLDATLNHVNAFAEYSCLADNTHGKIAYMDNLRCKIEEYSFEFVESAQLQIPPLHKVYCFGQNMEDLWAIYKE
jgi:Mg-chelatase subunit ChlD